MRAMALVPKNTFNEDGFWDGFFRSRGGLAFEWYAEWVDLCEMLSKHCGLNPSSDSQQAVLVPGCGNSELSAALYDFGFPRITNIDLCRGVIEAMLRKHLRLRPKMLWKVMDMTQMQFSDGSFDVVLDKGGLDALLGFNDEDSSSGRRYLSEVQRVLKSAGRFACITLGQKHVIGMLLSTFRHGWQVGIHQVMVSQPDSELRPFLFVATKQTANDLSVVSLTLSDASLVREETLESIQEENTLREKGSIDNPDADGTVSFDRLYPSRRLDLTLGGQGKSKTTYKAIILDAKEGHEVIKYVCAVFLVPKAKAHEWLYSSEEGQWQVVESAKAARLIMVYLETNLQPGNNVHLQDDLSPLVKDLLPSDCANSVAPFLMPHDGVCKGTLLEEIHSPLTGTMLVEDVLSSDKKKDFFRRLFFKRNPNLIQSEALLTPSRTDRRAGGGAKKKTKAGKVPHLRKQNSIDDLKVDHSYLASRYHEGMVAGLSLISSKLELWLSLTQQIRVMIVGLGAGLLPMFLYKHFPFSIIQVVELDPVVGEVAKRHFDFVEDDRMQLHVGDGVEAVAGIASPPSAAQENGDGQKLLQVLIIDADSSDPSNGLSCPPMEFLEESFLRNAKAALAPEGILIINVVSRARDPHLKADSRLSKVFEEVYTFQVNEDVNRVMFALPQSSGLKDLTGTLNAGVVLKKIATQFAAWSNGPNVKDILKQLKRIK